MRAALSSLGSTCLRRGSKTHSAVCRRPPEVKPSWTCQLPSPRFLASHCASSGSPPIALSSPSATISPSRGPGVEISVATDRRCPAPGPPCKHARPGPVPRRASARARRRWATRPRVVLPFPRPGFVPGSPWVATGSPLRSSYCASRRVWPRSHGPEPPGLIGSMKRAAPPGDGEDRVPAVLVHRDEAQFLHRLVPSVPTREAPSAACRAGPCRRPLLALGGNFQPSGQRGRRWTVPPP